VLLVLSELSIIAISKDIVLSRISRYHALAYGENVTSISPKAILHAGSQWAKQAQRLILETLEIVTIDNLMVRALMFLRIPKMILISDRHQFFSMTMTFAWGTFRKRL